MTRTWVEQWSRVQRFYARFSEINSGRVHDRDSDYYQDDVYSFFQNCYQLKDWLKNDPAASPGVGDIEGFISNSPNLSLCADLCNGSKHLKLTSSRASPDTKIGGRHIAVGLSTTLGSGNDDSTTISVKYGVESRGNTNDAFLVAEACIKEWETYLTEKGLIPQDESPEGVNADR